LSERVTRHAKLLGVIWAALLVVDLITGPGLWAHFPGIVLAALVMLEAAPLFTSGWFNLAIARGTVVIGALALINLATWSGYLWVMWPAGAFGFLILIRRLSIRSN
jgi:adenylate cyclase